MIIEIFFEGDSADGAHTSRAGYSERRVHGQKGEKQNSV